MPAHPDRFLDAMPDSAAWLDPQGNILVANRMWRTLARSGGMLPGSAGLGLNYLANCREVQGAVRNDALAAARGIEDVLNGTLHDFSLEYAWHAPGHERWFRLRASPLGAGQGALVMHLDITATRLAQKDVKRLNSLYAVASGINDAIVRIADEAQLFNQVCRIAVERDHMLMVWIGLVEPGSTAIRPVASWGAGQDVMNPVPPSTLPGQMLGEGLAATVFRTSQPACINDIAAEPAIAGGEQALAHGFASCGAFAIKIATRPVGVFVLYAGEAGFFDAEKLNLINALAENLSFAVESRRQHAQLEQRVLDRTRELQRANADLEGFSYSIAHDLRSPLGSINGFGKLLERDMPADAPEASRHYLSRIRSGATHMGEMIDALLALAQLSRTGIRYDDVDLSALAKAVVESLREAGPDRVVRVAVAEGMRARADSRLMRLVLENLLGNAWKFTSKCPDAAISFTQEATAGGGVAYAVSDNGIGFDMAHAGKLFSVFERMHGSQDYAGTGVGLANVQRIICRHHGRIWADAVPGQGATFRFTLAASP